jgi:hypothetical protein
MVRSILAAVLDTLAVGALGYAAFRFAVAVAPCADLGACSLLTPLVLGGVLLLVAAYFALGYVLFRATFGQRVAQR